MNQIASPRRRTVLAGALAAASLPLWRARAQTAAAGSVLNIAIVGEPNTLDPMWDTSGLLSELLEPMFELLYIFTPALTFAPVLASALPDISPDGLRYTIPLRTDVKFHDGTMMTADDVVSSFKRWMVVSPRGRLIAGYLAGLTAKDSKTVELTLKQSYAPLLALLAFPNGALVIMPKRFETQTQKPVTEFVGTGPWKFLEHVPDRYVRVTKFDGYVSPPGKADGYAGERRADIDELRFIPVTNVTTRTDGLISGQDHFIELAHRGGLREAEADRHSADRAGEHSDLADHHVQHQAGADGEREAAPRRAGRDRARGHDGRDLHRPLAVETGRLDLPCGYRVVD